MACSSGDPGENSGEMDAVVMADAGVADGDAAGSPADAADPPVDTAGPDGASSADTTGATGPYFPVGDTWETLDPAGLGWDAAGLAAAFEFAGSRGTRAMVLLLDGRILAERYWDADVTYRRDVASVQKSVMAILVGEAVMRGRLSLDDRVTKHLGMGWSNAPAPAEDAILVRHLLTMTSGLAEDLTFEAAPGTVWRYNNDAYHRVQAVLEAATGSRVLAVSRDYVWNAIGITTSLWYQRPGMPDAKGNPLFGLLMTARDMARFGLLIAEGGRWDGRQVITHETYLEAALTTSQPLNLSYGHLWWLNGKTSHRVPPRNELQEGALIPKAPADLVAALGKDDQKIYISRGTGLVLTRLGDSAGPRVEALSSFDNDLWEKIMAARPQR